MKSLAVSERYGLPRYVAHQAYYSLVGRDYEWELMPLALDQKVGTVVWSPLGWGRLTGKIRRGQPLPQTSRLQSKVVIDIGPQVADEYVYRVVDALDEVAKETGKTVPQVALNWLLQRPIRRERHHRRAQRGAAAAEPRRRRLEPDRGPGGQARRRQRHDAGLSLLASAGFRRAQSAAGLSRRVSRCLQGELPRSGLRPKQPTRPPVRMRPSPAPASRTRLPPTGSVLITKFYQEPPGRTCATAGQHLRRCAGHGTGEADATKRFRPTACQSVGDQDGFLHRLAWPRPEKRKPPPMTAGEACRAKLCCWSTIPARWKAPFTRRPSGPSPCTLDPALHPPATCWLSRTRK